MTMIRKQFFIDPEASRRLKHAAKARGVSEADLIRQGVDQVLAASTQADDWRVALRAAVAAAPPGIGDAMAESVAADRKRRAVTAKERRERLRAQWDDKR